MRMTILAISIVLLVTRAATAQRVGDCVVVTPESALLKTGTESVGTIGKGNILLVKQVKADWLWVTFRDGRTPLKGWINRRDVISFENALDFFSDEIRRNPDARVYAIRGMIHTSKHDHESALKDFNESLWLGPNSADVLYFRGSVWRIKGDLDNAIADFTEAIRNDSVQPSYYNDRGYVWAEKGDHDKAIADYNEAIRLGPGEAIRFANRGTAWNAKREFEKAIADYNEVIRLDPKFPNVRRSLALILAACPNPEIRDGKRAIEHATAACQSAAWADAGDIFALAAAYAEAGDFKNAVMWQKYAVDIAPKAKQDFCRSVLVLYEGEKPYRGVVAK
ncbi:MAG: tetratricopeptide repeat protein [Planctomycetia bacterium]|nr:tetratricopeptide repeat protein [Planctomycetia bacterium]